MKKVIATAVLMVAAAAATAQAGVNFNVNVDVPVAPAPQPAPVVVPAYPPPAPAPVPAPPAQIVIEEPPQFIYAPSMGMYVSVGIPYDIVYADRGYYLYSGGYWYYSPAYWGPWAFVPQRRLPVGLRRYRYEQIRHFRDREYRVYLHDREHYRGNWYRPNLRAEHRMERREDRREGRHEERREWR